MATFSNFVFDTSSQNPPQIGPSLSASDNSVIFLPTVLIYNTTSSVPASAFATPPLSATQVTAITGSPVLSGFYTGWKSSGVTVGTKYTDTQFNSLTAVYNVAPLSSQYAALTSSIVPTSQFSSGTYGGKTPVGILFNQIAGADTATTTLSVTDRIQFKVAPAYDGATFALYFGDCSTTTFTVATGTATQVVTGAVGFDNRGPNERRRFAIEG